MTHRERAGEGKRAVIFDMTPDQTHLVNEFVAGEIKCQCEKIIQPTDKKGLIFQTFSDYSALEKAGKCIVVGLCEECHADLCKAIDALKAKAKSPAPSGGK